MDRGPRRYLPAISLRGESNNLESRIERVSGMYFFEKLAGRLGKRDKHVSDVLRKERCPGSREHEYVQSMRYRGNVSVTPDIRHASLQDQPGRRLVAATPHEAHPRFGVGRDHGYPQGPYRRQDQGRTDLRRAEGACADDVGRRKEIRLQCRCTSADELERMAAMIEQRSVSFAEAPSMASVRA
jgi:hypothetical protein